MFSRKPILNSFKDFKTLNLHLKNVFPNENFTLKASLNDNDELIDCQCQLDVDLSKFKT